MVVRAAPPAGLDAGGAGLLLQIGPLPIHFLGQYEPGVVAVKAAVSLVLAVCVPVVHGEGCSVHPRSAAHGLPVTFQVACKRAVFG
jgi:hypothetical protein